MLNRIESAVKDSDTVVLGLLFLALATAIGASTGSFLLFVVSIVPPYVAMVVVHIIGELIEDYREGRLFNRDNSLEDNGYSSYSR